MVIEFSDYRNLGRPISDDESGTRLDWHLGKSFLFRSRHQWCKLIRRREVLVNDEPTKVSYRLKVGDRICYYNPLADEPVVDRHVRLLWQDGEVAAVHKTPNLPMHEGGAYRRNTFQNVLQTSLGVEWAAVHRLDRETSGVVLCSSSPEQRGWLSDGFRNKRFQKTYLAISCGVPTAERLVVEEPIGDATGTTFRTKKWVVPGGQFARTTFEVVDRIGDAFALLRVFPETGRTHQIRVHAAWSGFPLVGDKKYALDERVYLHYLDHGFDAFVQDACFFDRMCLHAHVLEFVHPLSGDVCKVQSPMPRDMNDIWSALCASYRRET